MKKFSTNKFVIKIFILLQILFLVVFLLAIKFLPESQGYLGKGLGELVDQPLVYSRANFDGFHYLKIARDGYGYLQQAFFPFYPRLIKFFQSFLGSYLVSGILISNLSFFLALFFLAKLLVLEGAKEAVVKKTIFFISFFPTSFYFLSAYTESLFLFLLVLSFYLAKKEKWFWAGLVGGLVSFTRIVGIFVFPALVLKYLNQNGYTLKKIIKPNRLKNLLFICFSCWGLVTYCLMLKKTTGDFLYFVHAQPQFGAQRTVGKIILLYQVFWRYLKMIFTVDPSNIIYFNVWLEFGTAILFLALFLVCLTKFKIPLFYLVFSFLAFILPTLTGTFLSLPRFVLVLFPVFWIMGKVAVKFRRLGIIYSILSALLLIVCAALFLRGYWVA